MEGPPPTPARLGYRMPPEWHPHQATWLSWPTNRETWPGRLKEVQSVYLELIRTLSRQERVELLVDDSATAQRVRQSLQEAEVPAGSVQLHCLPTVDAWIRDYGPNFLIRPVLPDPVAYNHWRFNAWGNKYPELAADTDIPRRLQNYLRMPRFQPGLVLEGGSIEVDESGLCLTTEQCLLNPNRNPHCSRADLERALTEFLGVEKVIWLGEGVEGDDTDGHIDDIARFVGRGRVLCTRERRRGDPNFGPLEENWSRLRKARDPKGQRLELIELPMPDPLLGPEGRLPASYANFYLANGLVLVPVFQDARDQQVLKLFEELFPERKVIPIPSRDLVLGLGAVHCLTQQQPLPPERLEVPR